HALLDEFLEPGRLHRDVVLSRPEVRHDVISERVGPRVADLIGAAICDRNRCSGDCAAGWVYHRSENGTGEARLSKSDCGAAQNHNEEQCQSTRKAYFFHGITSKVSILPHAIPGTLERYSGC